MWLLITLISYLLNAIAMVVDKTLLKRDVKNPFVYTFYIAALGGAVILVVAPFGLAWPGWYQFWLAIIAGAIFTVGLFLLFFALKKEEASRVTPMVGGLNSVITVMLAALIINESLNNSQWLAIILIMAASFLISVEWSKNKKTVIKHALWLSLPAAFFFALSAVLNKDIYTEQGFISGFIWTRIGAFAMAIVPMILKQNRHDLLRGEKGQGLGQAKYRFLFGQFAGGASAVLLQYAISIASVSLVQALQGTQYIFIFIGVILLTKLKPKLLSESLERKVIWQKIISIITIGFGIFLLI